MKHIKKFNEKLSDVKIELIGPSVDEILDAINFINDNYKDVKIKPTDFQEQNPNKPYAHKRNSNYSIFVELEPNVDESKHIRFINDLLTENDFICRLYII